jgi:hypothetical protein
MKPDTASGYASKGVDFPKMGAHKNTHQNLSTFQGLIHIEKCQLSKKMDTHYTNYASKSVNLSRKKSIKSRFTELVYRKKGAVTLQASHRVKEERSGKGDTYHLLSATYWGLDAVPPFLLRSGACLSSPCCLTRRRSCRAPVDHKIIIVIYETPAVTSGVARPANQHRLDRRKRQSDL